MKEEDKLIKVYLVNPPSENPWRTQGDYRREQKRKTIRFWITIASFMVSIISVAVTPIVAVMTIRGVAP